MKERKFLDCMDARRDLYARALHIADLMYDTDKKYYGQWDISRVIQRFDIIVDRNVNRKGIKMLEIESAPYIHQCGDSETHFIDFPIEWMYTDDSVIVNKVESLRDARAEKVKEHEELMNLKIKYANEKHDRNEYERLKKKYGNE